MLEHGTVITLQNYKALWLAHEPLQGILKNVHNMLNIDYIYLKLLRNPLCVILHFFWKFRKL